MLGLALAITALAPRPVLCLAPAEDGDTGCPTSGGAGYERRKLPGGHHFGGAYDDLAARIAAFIGEVSGTFSPHGGIRGAVQEKVPDTIR